MMDVTCTQMLGKIEAWCMILAFTCAASALVVVNNIAQLAGALNNQHTNLLVIFIGIANSLGRHRNHPTYLCTRMTACNTETDMQYIC